jgi:hypothetical protein
MDRRSFIRLGASVAGASLLGGCAPPWHVVVRAAPDPFVGQRKFGVLRIDYAGLKIVDKTEAEYLGGKEPKQAESLREDKVALDAKFLEHLQAKAREGGIEVVAATGPGDAPFVLRPAVSYIDPGFYVGLAGAPSMVHLNVKIAGADGRVLDEIELAHGTDPSSGVSIAGASLPAKASSGGRLQKDGEELGKLVALYVMARVG